MRLEIHRRGVLVEVESMPELSAGRTFKNRLTLYRGRVIQLGRTLEIEQLASAMPETAEKLSDDNPLAEVFRYQEKMAEQYKAAVNVGDDVLFSLGDACPVPVQGFESCLLIGVDSVIVTLRAEE